MKFTRVALILLALLCGAWTQTQAGAQTTSVLSTDSAGNTSIAGLLRVPKITVNAVSPFINNAYSESYLTLSPNQRNCLFEGYDGGYNGSFASTSCAADTMVATDPGFSHGNDGISYYTSWDVHLANQGFHLCLSAGICEASESLTHTGVGDTHWYKYLHDYGGVTASSDEATEGVAVYVDEPGTQFTGIVASLEPSANRVHVNCTTDCQNPGVGRFLTQHQSTPQTGYIMAHDQTGPGGSTVLTIGGTSVIASTAVGTLQNACTVSNASNRKIVQHGTTCSTL